MDIDEILAKRKKLSSEIERLRGRLEQARENLIKVEAECQKQDVDPEDLDQVIAKLDKKRATLVSEIEAETSAVEEALKAFRD